MRAKFFFLWKTNTPFVGNPFFVQEGEAILKLPKKAKNAICVESDDADKHGDSGEPKNVISVEGDIQMTSMMTVVTTMMMMMMMMTTLTSPKTPINLMNNLMMTGK